MGKIKIWRDEQIVEVEEDELFPGGPPAPLPDPAKRYSKRRLIGAMTDAEYDVFEAAEKGQPKRKARIFRESTELNDADADFAEFKAALEAVFPNGRAGELLQAALVS